MFELSEKATLFRRQLPHSILNQIHLDVYLWGKSSVATFDREVEVKRHKFSAITDARKSDQQSSHTAFQSMT